MDLKGKLFVESAEFGSRHFRMVRFSREKQMGICLVIKSGSVWAHETIEYAINGLTPGGGGGNCSSGRQLSPGVRHQQRTCAETWGGRGQAPALPLTCCVTVEAS